MPSPAESKQSIVASKTSAIVSKTSAIVSKTSVVGRKASVSISAPVVASKASVVSQPAISNQPETVRSKPSVASKGSFVARRKLSGIKAVADEAQQRSISELHAHDVQGIPTHGKVATCSPVGRQGFRDAMGDYHPPPGGKYLTSLEGSIPAPNQYHLPNLNLTMHAAPGWYLTSRQETKLEKTDEIGPFSYCPTSPLKCKHPLLPTLKSRIKSPNYKCAPPPNKYLIKNDDIAQKKSKFTFKSRPPPNCCIGPPNPLDRTSSTKTPAPNRYNSVTCHLPTPPKYVFNHRHLPSEESAGPGAATVNVQLPPGGRKYSLQPLPTPLTPIMNNPGPGAYDPNYHSVDPDPIMQTIATRLSDPTPDQMPPPNAYNTIKAKKIGQSMPFRPFEPLGEFRTPAPNSYLAEKYPKKIAPEYTMGEKPRQYRNSENVHGGPGTRNIRSEPASRPAFKFTGKPQEKIEDTPASNAYSPRNPATTRKGFSIAGLPPKSKPETIPAPNAYLPNMIKPRAPEMPLGIKHRDIGGRELAMIPSPAHYNVGKSCGCTAFRRNKPGFSFRGRASKFVYSGYDIGRNFAKMPAHFENTRKTIT